MVAVGQTYRSELVASARRGLEQYESGKVDASALAKGLRDIADMLDGAAKPDDVKAVFSAWVQALGKDAQRTKLTKDREQRIKARLRERYSVAEIIIAIKNCAASSFHRGDNDHGRAYDDITLICRNGSKLEQFRDMGPHKLETTTKAPKLAESKERSTYRDVGW